MSFNLATILRESAIATPEKTCLYFLGREIRYAELDELSTRFARGLREAGLGRGDVLALSLPNLPEFVIAYFGALKAAVTVMPLNPLLKSDEIVYHLTDSGARHLVAFESFAAEARAAADAVPGTVVHVVPVPGGPPPDGARRFADLLPEHPSDPVAEQVRGEPEPTSADDVAVLLYTSGTTGRPKGAELSHFQLYMNCTVSGELFGLEPDDIAFGALPLFHVFGLSSVLNVAVRYGGAVSLLPRFEPQEAIERIAADGVSVLLGVPTMYLGLLGADRTGLDLGRLRIGTSGGASLPGEVLRAFEEAFGIVILEGYGLSETASTATFNRSAADRRVLSVGKPVWGVQLRVVDQDDRPLPRGADQIGEVVLRGHNVIAGYHRRPEATAEVFGNGWFHTGDLGYLDEDGYLFIVDRKKDLVIRGGLNVYPREVEEVLYTHPAVEEAAVIGHPDPRLGEEVGAVVSLKVGATVTEEEISAFCKERMAAYKYPRVVRFVDQLPKGPSGKILKKELRRT
ncbi:long-chain-fatty-acid--CoA ligase [Amycolatopsis nigrescens]|uniref:long-chain-fatty-acid--CoA ligase n=1 Tax=Amycolatopsis nigrescens TaxID=381445 RepID=UPI000477F140|nr:long-chain fatty acid--CoA ligase [Amycolatopsis nigrescens]